MAILIFAVRGQEITCGKPKVMVSDTIKYFDAQFVFHDVKWEGLTKFAHFSDGDNVWDAVINADGSISDQAQMNNI